MTGHDPLLSLSESPRWFPFEIDSASEAVALIEMDEAAYRAASFLDPRMLAPNPIFHRTNWPNLVAATPADTRADAHYIFHIGNVGSTLISRLLGELLEVFALREPMILRSFASMSRDWAAERTGTLNALLSRTYRSEQRAIVKATSFTSEIADLLLPADSRALFLFATPDHYLENILAGENSWQTLDALSPVRLARLQSRCPGLGLDLSKADDGIRAALGWACEMTSLEAAASKMPEGAVLWMDFDQFLTDPAIHFSDLAVHFGLSVSSQTADAICTGPLMSRYSKAMDYDYSPDLRRQILAQARREHAGKIAKAKDWLNSLASDYPVIAAAIRRAGEE